MSNVLQNRISRQIPSPNASVSAADSTDEEENYPPAPDRPKLAMVKGGTRKTGNFDQKANFDQHFLIFDGSSQVTGTLPALPAPAASEREPTRKYHPCNDVQGRWKSTLRWHHQVVGQFGQDFVQKHPVAYYIHIELLCHPNSVEERQTDAEWTVSYGLSTWFSSTGDRSAYKPSFKHPKSGEEIAYDKLLLQHGDVAKDVLDQYKFVKLRSGQKLSDKWGEYVLVKPNCHSWGPYHDYEGFLNEFTTIYKKYLTASYDELRPLCSSDTEYREIVANMEEIQKSANETAAELLGLPYANEASVLPGVRTRRSHRPGEMGQTKKRTFVHEPSASDSDVVPAAKKTKGQTRSTENQENVEPYESQEELDREGDGDYESDEGGTPRGMSRKEKKFALEQQKIRLRGTLAERLSQKQSNPPTVIVSKEYLGTTLLPIGHQTVTKSRVMPLTEALSGEFTPDPNFVQPTCSNALEPQAISVNSSESSIQGFSVCSENPGDMNGIVPSDKADGSCQSPSPASNMLDKAQVGPSSSENNGFLNPGAPNPPVTPACNTDFGTSVFVHDNGFANLASDKQHIGDVSASIQLPKTEDERWLLIFSKMAEMTKEIQSLKVGCCCDVRRSATASSSLSRTTFFLNDEDDETLQSSNGQFVSASTPHRPLRQHNMHASIFGYHTKDGPLGKTFYIGTNRFLYRGPETSPSTLRAIFHNLMPEDNFPARSAADLIACEERLRNNSDLLLVWNTLARHILNRRTALSELQQSATQLMFEVIQNNKFELGAAINVERVTRAGVFTSILQCTEEMVRFVHGEKNASQCKKDLEDLAFLHQRASTSRFDLLKPIVEGDLNPRRELMMKNDVTLLFYKPILEKVEDYNYKFKQQEGHNCKDLTSHADLCKATARAGFCLPSRNDVSEVFNAIMGEVKYNLQRRVKKPKRSNGHEDYYSDHDDEEAKRKKYIFKKQFWDVYVDKNCGAKKKQHVGESLNVVGADDDGDDIHYEDDDVMHLQEKGRSDGRSVAARTTRKETAPSATHNRHRRGGGGSKRGQTGGGSKRGQTSGSRARGGVQANFSTPNPGSATVSRESPNYFLSDDEESGVPQISASRTTCDTPPSSPEK